MTGDQDAKRRDEEHRELFAIRREEQAMAAEERKLEEELKSLDADLTQAERTIDADLRQQHWGHDPEQPPFWPRRHSPPAARACRTHRHPPERRGDTDSVRTPKAPRHDQQ
jgi:hypothetical protein